MKKILILFVSVILAGSPLMPVQADENQASSEPVMTEQPTVEESSADRNAYAKSLFEGRCQMCHQLPEPGMLKPKQWKLVLVTMQQRMQQAGVPSLTADETERLLEYLAEQAG